MTTIPAIFLESAEKIMNASNVNDFDESLFLLETPLRDGENDIAKHNVFMWCAFMMNQLGIRITPERDIFLVNEPYCTWLVENALDDDREIAITITKVAVNNLFQIGAPRLAVALINTISNEIDQAKFMGLKAFTPYRLNYVELITNNFDLKENRYLNESRFFVGWPGNYISQTPRGRKILGVCKHGLFLKPRGDAESCLISWITKYNNKGCKM
jgi:hypothetical protein